jgi:hypothetical protein
MAGMAIEDNWASPTGTCRPLEAVLDELDCNALDVIAYLMDLQKFNGRVDAAGAACIRRRLELLDELEDALDDRSLPCSSDLM